MHDNPVSLQDPINLLPGSVDDSDQLGSIGFSQNLESLEPISYEGQAPYLVERERIIPGQSTPAEEELEYFSPLDVFRRDSEDEIDS